MPLTVLLDTNVFVSALINPHGFPARILNKYLKGNFEVVVSIPLLQELVRVLYRPRIKNKYAITDDEIDSFIQLIFRRARLVTPRGKLKICRDPTDDAILETALLGNAKYIVTRDEDIKGDKKVISKMQSRGVTILTVRAFLRKLAHKEL